MDLEEKQTLLVNSLRFAHKVLTPEEYFKIDFDRIVYKMSGETSMLVYQSGKFIIQGFIYSTRETRTMILVRGTVYDSEKEVVNL